MNWRIRITGYRSVLITSNRMSMTYSRRLQNNKKGAPQPVVQAAPIDLTEVLISMRDTLARVVDVLKDKQKGLVTSLVHHQYEHSSEVLCFQKRQEGRPSELGDQCLELFFSESGEPFRYLSEWATEQPNAITIEQVKDVSI